MTEEAKVNWLLVGERRKCWVRLRFWAWLTEGVETALSKVGRTSSLSGSQLRF